MTDEPKYTLEEARRILARKECYAVGHELTQELDLIRSRALAPLVHCTRCGTGFVEPS